MVLWLYRLCIGGHFLYEFTNPIEASIQSPINRVMTFINAASAENQGVEVEVFKTLDFLGDLGGFHFQGNVPISTLP